MHLDISEKSILCENSQVNCRRPRPGQPLCLRSRNSLGHFTNHWNILKPFCHENLQVKCRKPRPGQPFCASLRSRNAACICQKSHVTREFTGKMVETRVSTLIKHRPLHLLQEPLSVGTLFGEPATWKMQRALANRNVIKWFGSNFAHTCSHRSHDRELGSEVAVSTTIRYP